MSLLKFRSIGECMAELQLAKDGHYGLAFGGDTLNTSWYVRALASPENLEVEYVTAVGGDPMSMRLLDFLNSKAIGTNFVRSVKERNLGLYLITLTGAERSFTYWRDSSAAKLLAEDKVHLERSVSGADLVYFSGITLAILSPQHRQVLLEHLQQLKARGTIIAFDSNTRPRLWSSPGEMKEATIRACKVATIALPTFSDEQFLFGDETITDCANRIASYGVDEVLVKDGANACCGLLDGTLFELKAPPVSDLVDTTGAGDSFNAGYLVGRMHKLDAKAAASLGHQVAGRVICHRGALVEMSAFADLRLG
ncbi:MAG: sugar kinase [Aestuariivirga sp.]